MLAATSMIASILAAEYLRSPKCESQPASGAAQFIADPMYQARTVVVPVDANSPEETRFVKDLAIQPAESSASAIVLLAPPAAAIGKFPATATADQIAAALHAAGKCCDDPNYKHNQQGR